jgi:hypothetical protein
MVFSDVKPYTFVGRYNERGTLKMEIAGSSETIVFIPQTTRRHILEDSLCREDVGWRMKFLTSIDDPRETNMASLQ